MIMRKFTVSGLQKIGTATHFCHYNIFSKNKPLSLFFIAYSLLLIAFSTGCAKEPISDARQFARGYFKDKTSEAPGISEGIGPSKEKAATEKIIDLGKRETKEYDFGDDTSNTLTIKAWEALNHKDEKGVFLFTERCVKLYADEAKKQGEALADYPDRANIDMYQQMNDVGACYFIRGEFFKYKKDWQKALKSYQTLIDKYQFAQYWDPRGWYWKPAEIARDEIRKINEGYYEK